MWGTAYYCIVSKAFAQDGNKRVLMAIVKLFCIKAGKQVAEDLTDAPATKLTISGSKMVLHLPLSHTRDMLAITGAPYMAIFWLKNALPHVLKHLTYLNHITI